MHASRCTSLCLPLQLSLDETLAVLAALLAHPLYTLPLASAFRSQLLRLCSALVEAYISQHLPAQQAATFSVALVTLLELAPHINGLLLRFFDYFPAPHAHILQRSGASTTTTVGTTAATSGATAAITTAATGALQQQDGQQALSDDARLAFASLRAMQLEQRLAAVWRGSGFRQLLNHEDPDVRWAGVELSALNMKLVSWRGLWYPCASFEGRSVHVCWCKQDPPPCCSRLLLLQ